GAWSDRARAAPDARELRRLEAQGVRPPLVSELEAAPWGRGARQRAGRGDEVPRRVPTAAGAERALDAPDRAGRGAAHTDARARAGSARRLHRPPSRRRAAARPDRARR